MMLQEAKNTLDNVIPAPGNRMVDGEHLQIAVAWQEIKCALADYAVIADERSALLRRIGSQVETIRQKIDAGTLTHEDRKLLDDLQIPHQYDKR